MVDAVPKERGESEVRQRLLEAAMRAFLEEDYQRVSMRRVAQEAGSNMSMIYYYFGNKEGLFEAVLAGQGESLMLTAFDMQMLMGTEGRERTANEWQKLCDEAGYRIAHSYDTRSLWKLQMLTPWKRDEG
jgi:AcrR family transcriptional regulator